MSDILLQGAPEAWPLYRLGQLFSERKEKVSDTEFPPLSVTKLGILPQLETAAKSDAGDNRKGVHPGDFVINSRSDRKGSGGVSELKGSVSLISIVLEPKSTDTRFVHHLLRCTAFQEEFYRWGHGIVADLWTTRWSDMKNIRVRVPDLDTQKAIADFLDRETARIDQLIEKKQRLVELLGERRASSITSFVSGERLGADRLETGSRWFPELPEGWRVSALKHLVGPISDGPHVSPTYSDEGVLFLSTRNIKPDRWDFSDVKYISPELYQEFCRRSKPEMGDVLYTKGGTTGVARAVDLEEPFQIWVHVALLKPRPSKVRPDFLAHALNSRPCYEQSQLFTRGATNNDLGLNRMARIKLPVPSIADQKKICAQLDEELDLIDRTAANVSASIDRLKEYRSALITAAVTGQIDATRWGQTGEGDKRLDQIQEAAAG